MQSAFNFRKKNVNKFSVFVGINVNNADNLVMAGGEPIDKLHVTLLWGYATTADYNTAITKVKTAVEEIKHLIPNSLVFDAIDTFGATPHSEGKKVIYARVAAGQLEQAHNSLLQSLKKQGLQVSQTFEEYHPHMTLAYVNPKETFKPHRIKPVKVDVIDLTVDIENEDSETHDNSFNMAKSFSDILKFNPYHDKLGRFSNSGSAASFTYKPGASTAHTKAIENEKAKSGESKAFKGTLYHGSPNKNIEEFDMKYAGKNTSSGEKLLFFTDSKQMADDFSYERLEGSSKFFQERGKKGRVYEVDVEMKNPLDFRKLSNKDIDNILKLDEDGILTAADVQRYAQSNHQLLKAGLNLTSDSLKNLGYDGLIANTGKAGHNSLEYAVIDSSQAKIKKSIAKSFSDILKYNKWHGKDGRFTYGPGGGVSAGVGSAAGSNEDNILSQVALDKVKRIEKFSVDRTTEEVCVIDESGNIVYRNTGDERHVEMNGQWHDAEGYCIATHNHPSEFGGTFSSADIEAFEETSNLVKSTRVVGKEGVYSLTRLDNINPEGHKS